jgi:hypothetical protein
MDMTAPGRSLRQPDRVVAVATAASTTGTGSMVVAGAATAASVVGTVAGATVVSALVLVVLAAVGGET